MGSFFVHRRVKTCLGSLASKIQQSEETEEPFKPFQLVKEFSDEPSDAASSGSITKIGNINSRVSTSTVLSSQNQNVSSPRPSSARSSALLLSLSPPRNKETSGEGFRTPGKLNDTIGASDKKSNSETIGTPRSQFLGGFRGGMAANGTEGRPSPVSRLSFVDTKWLERCQVFGEIVAEERPAAGNQEVQAERKEEREPQGEMQGGERVDKGEIAAEGERGEVIDPGRDEGIKSINGDERGEDIVPKAARQPSKKGKGGEEEKEKKKRGEEMQREPTPPPTLEDEGETTPKAQGTKKRGRKRQREGDDTEGGVKKKRSVKKKEESSDLNPSPSREGGKKRRTKKKVEEDGEEEEKPIKEPQKVRMLN